MRVNRTGAGVALIVAMLASAAGCSSSSDGGGFFGDPGASSCSCQGKFDNKVCASTMNAADPEPACRVCCLNNGYVGENYSGIIMPECGCT